MDTVEGEVRLWLERVPGQKMTDRLLPGGCERKGRDLDSVERLSDRDLQVIGFQPEAHSLPTPRAWLPTRPYSF